MNKKKKIFMSMILSLAAVFPAAAQDGNMALGCRATASTEAGAHTADKAVDGDAAGDSRWESLFNDVADADAQWWSVDLGEPREFDMIQIVWEGAYAKAFRIVVAGNEDFSDARTVIERDEMLTTLTQNYDLPEAVTARYIRFEGIERALPYGYSFYEFGIYKKTAPVLTTLTAVPSAEMCRLGGSITVDCSALDQYGSAIDADNVMFEVSPADAGTFSGNTFTPAAVGVATITARAGEVSAAPFDIVCYDGSNIASADKVTGCNEEADAATMAFAFNGDEGPGEWILHGNTGDTEDDRTYDAWFTLDLGKDYGLSMVSVCFEGASSAAYTIAFSADGEEWTEAAAVSHAPGINAWKDRIGGFTADASAVRYIRFMSTVAATQYGVKVREFAVYGRAVEGELIASREPDAATGATVLDGELNDATAAFFADDNSTAYDMRGVNITAAMAITPVNPNAMFIVTPAQAGLLAGTPNIIIYNAGEYRAASIVLTDRHDVNTRLAVKAAEVSYSRTATDGYQTLVVPFAAAVPAGIRAYALVDRTPAGILFQESLTLEAGVPYLITGGAALSLSASDALLDFRLTPNNGDDATFEGTYAMLQAVPGSYILDAGGMFRRTADGATVPAFRAWLTLTDASAAKMAVVFGDETGISTPATAVTESPAYTIGGVKIPAGSKPLKGLIVENGRKTVKR